MALYQRAALSGFGASDNDSILQRFVKRTKPEDRDAEALIRWGAAADFGMDDQLGLGRVSGGTVTYPPRPDDEEEEPEIEEYVETDYESVKVRVENPDDPDQYVMVENTTRSLIQRPDGSQFYIKWKDR